MFSNFQMIKKSKVVYEFEDDGWGEKKNYVSDYCYKRLGMDSKSFLCNIATEYYEQAAKLLESKYSYRNFYLNFLFRRREKIGRDSKGSET